MNRIVRLNAEIEPGYTIRENLVKMLEAKEAGLLVIRKNTRGKDLVLSVVQGPFNWVIFEGKADIAEVTAADVLEVDLKNVIDDYSITYLSI